MAGRSVFLRSVSLEGVVALDVKMWNARLRIFVLGVAFHFFCIKVIIVWPLPFRILSKH